MDKGRVKKLCRDILLYGVFALYLVLLAAILFRQHHETRSVNLIPFRSILQYLTGTDPLAGEVPELQARFLRGLALSNLLGNLVIFVPLGVYARLFGRRLPLWACALLPAGASLLAEGLQFATSWGVADVDDWLLNALGGLLGVLLCQGLFRLCKSRERARTAVAALAPLAGIASFALLLLINR